MAGEVAENLTMENGAYMLEGETNAALAKEGAWAMLIDNDSLSVVWHTELFPPNIPVQYTAGDISEITRGYIQDFPAFTASKGADLVVVGYYTGGRAFAQYMGNAASSTNVEQRTKSLDTSITASLTYEGDSLNASFGFNGKNGNFDSTVYKKQDIFLRVKTLGGIQNEESAINTTMSLKDINIDLQSWRKSQTRLWTSLTYPKSEVSSAILRKRASVTFL